MNLVLEGIVLRPPDAPLGSQEPWVTAMDWRNGTMVIDFGSDTTKAGLAVADWDTMHDRISSSDLPIHMRSVVSHYQGEGSAAGSAADQGGAMVTDDGQPDGYVVGDDCYLEPALALTARRVISRGIIQSWDDVHTVCQHTMAEAAHPLPMLYDATPVMLSRLPSMGKTDVQQLVQTFFEDFEVPHVSVVSQATLALYGFGVTTGVVVDIGHESIDITPILEGVVTPGAARTLALGCSDFAGWVKESLAKRASGPVEVDEMEARFILERHVSVACTGDGVSEDADAAATCAVAGKGEVRLGAERRSCMEQLFQNRSWDVDGSGVPLQFAVHEAVMSHSECYQKKEQTASHDPTVKQRMFQNVIVCGGGACIPGLREVRERDCLSLHSRCYSAKD